jgi:hypothetical protein
MDRFLADAQSILTTAASALASGESLTDLVILTGSQAPIQMIAGCDWPLDSIRTERGADTAYRVTCRNSRVAVEGNQPGRTCHLEQSIVRHGRPAVLSHTLPGWMAAIPHQTRLLT